MVLKIIRHLMGDLQHLLDIVIILYSHVTIESKFNPPWQEVQRPVY